jgi:hypothetical protein
MLPPVNSLEALDQIAGAKITQCCRKHTSIFVRLAEPDKHLEAITSRPLLLSSVGKLTESGRQKTLTITHSHGRAQQVQETYQRVQIFFDGLRAIAPQLSELECWCRILSEAMKKYLGGKVLKPPNQIAHSQ